jgi:quercetin dioxygenase-like cupin family protein
MKTFTLSEIAQFDDTKVRATPLISSGESRQMLFTFRAGQELASHRARGPISVLILSGRLQFAAGGEARMLEPGQFVTLDAGIQHSVRADQDSVMLLTLLPATPS